MRKFKMFIDIEKEEQWLNDQLQKGYRCTNINGFGIYTFKETDKKCVIRLDYQHHLSKKKMAEYKGIFEDFGWTYIKGSWLSGIRYWQREDDEHNEIFSDRQSKRNYYKRLMVYSFGLGVLCLIYSFMLYKDSALYHQGIWNMKDALFWKAFLFETPFVLLKLFPLLMVVLFGGSYYKSFREYQILKEE